MNAGLIGGVIGCALGLAGGLIGSYCSFNNAKGPRERRFAICASITLFAFTGLILALLSLLPQQRIYILASHFIVSGLGIKYINRLGSRIRHGEQ